MKALFGGVVASILLGLYVYSVVSAIFTVQCSSQPGCKDRKVEDFSDGMASTMTTVGALVSALVITELAVTKPGATPGIRSLGQPNSDRTAIRVTIAIYLVVWLGTGTSAFVVGVMDHPKILQPLTDVGQAWLGLGIAATYAYFGITPNGNKSMRRT